MRAAYAILLGILSGVFAAFIDLLATLSGYSATLAEVLYYTGLNGMLALAALLLVQGAKRVWYLALILFLSVFFAMEAVWNMVYGIIAWQTGTLHFPLNVGLGHYVSAEQYYTGVLVQLFIAFLFYLVYRLQTP